MNACILRILSCNLVNYDMQIKVGEALLWSRLYEKYFSWSFHTFSVNWLKAPCNLSQDRIAWAILLQSLCAGQNLWNSIAVHTGVLAKNHFWLVATQKKKELENYWTIFETCVLNPFHGQKVKEHFFPTGSGEDHSQRKLHLSNQNITFFLICQMGDNAPD